jgi:hypothetical protein
MAALVTYTGMPFANSAPFGGTAGTVPVANQGSEIYDITEKETIVEGTITLTANYGTTTSHGDALDFTLDSQVPPGAPPSGANIGPWAPNRVEIFEAPQAGTAPLGYTYVYCPGPTSTSATAAPTQAGGVLWIGGAGAGAGQGAQEITEGSAYSGFTPSLNNAVLRFRAWFARQ